MDSAINRPDIISDDALAAPLILAKNLEEAIKAARELVAVTKGTSMDVTSITEAKKAVADLSLEQQQLIKIQKQIQTAEAQTNEEYIKSANTLKAVKKELKDKVALGDRDAKSLNKQNASIEELGAALNKNRAAYAKLRTEEQRNTKEGKALLAVVQQQDAEFKELRQSMGQHQDNVGNYSVVLKDLKAELKAANGEMAAIADTLGQSSPQYQEAAKRAGEIADKIADAKDEAKAWQGDTAIENLGTRFGLLGSKIKNLDFKGAAQQIDAIGKLSRAMTFKEAISGLGGFGKSLLQLGKIILTNPLFLIAAAIVGLIVAIVKLKDSFMPLRIVFAAIGQAVQFVIEKFYQLTDAIGFTSHAEEKATQKYLDNLDKRKKATEDYYSFFIRLAQARGKETTQLEIESLNQFIRLNQERMRILAKQAKDTIVTSFQQVGPLMVPITVTVPGSKEAEKEFLELREANRVMNEEIILLTAAAQTKMLSNKKDASKKEKDILFELQKFRIEQLIKEQELIVTNDQRTLEARNQAALRAARLRGALVSLVRKHELDDELEDVKLTENEKQLIRERANAQTLDDARKLQADKNMLADIEIAKQIETLTRIQNNINASYDQRINAAVAVAELIGKTEIEIAEETAQRIIAIQKSIVDEEERLANERQKVRNTLRNNEVAALDEEYANGGMALREYVKRKEDIETKYKNLAIQKDIDRLEAQRESLISFGMSTIDVDKAISEARLAIAAETAEERVQYEQRFSQAVKDIGNQMLATALEFQAAGTEYRLRALETQLENEEAAKDRSIAIVGDDAQAKAFIEAEYARKKEVIEKQIAAQKRKQFIFDRTINAGEIIFQTAKGVATAVGTSPLTFGLPWSAFVAATGALQLARLFATPIPQFKDGVTDFGGGLAIVGDGFKPEWVDTPKGSFMSPNYPVLVDLPAHSNVYNGDETRALALQGLISGAKDGGSTGYDFIRLENKIDQFGKRVESAVLRTPQDVYDEVGYRRYERSVSGRILRLNKRYKLS